MTRLLLRMHLLTVAIAASYLTLGIANPHEARDLWAPYAIVTFLLAIANMLSERGKGRRRA